MLAEVQLDSRELLDDQDGVPVAVPRISETPRVDGTALRAEDRIGIDEEGETLVVNDDLVDLLETVSEVVLSDAPRHEDHAEPALVQYDEPVRVDLHAVVGVEEAEEPVLGVVGGALLRRTP